MREIKFRHWNGGEMTYEIMAGKFGVFYVNPDNNGIHTLDSASLSPFNTKLDSSFPIMQYTGLKDKNGKEIYEGDILKDDITVIWREDLASFALFKKGWMYDHYFGEAVDAGQCEVIGNIYANPL